MIGVRHARATFLTSAATLWEAVEVACCGAVVGEGNRKPRTHNGQGRTYRFQPCPGNATLQLSIGSAAQDRCLLPTISRDHSNNAATQVSADAGEPKATSQQQGAGPDGLGGQGLAEIDEERVKEVLLQKAISHVAAEGWTVRAIQRAAEDLDLSPMFAGVCDGKEKDLVEHFIRSCNNRLFTKLRAASPEFVGLSTADKVKLAVRWRLEMLVPHINTWPRAMAVMAHPGNVAKALELMAELMDGIWDATAAGGSSQDASKHSKRLMLQVIYTTTELYMLTDFSPGHVDTWQALDRRVEDALALGEGAQHLEQSVMEVVNRLRTFGRP